MEDYYVWGPSICETDGNTASWPVFSDVFKQISLLLEKSSTLKV